MAEAILFSVADRIIGRLGSIAMQKIGSIWGVKDELQQLENTVSTIKAVLLDAEDQQRHNHQVRRWLMRLQFAVYDTEDLLDDFSIEALRRGMISIPGNKRVVKQVTTFFSTSNQLVFGCNMAHKIKDIKKKLDGIAADRINFHLEERIEDKGVVSWVREQTHSFVVEDQVIGRVDDKIAILNLLLDGESKENVEVIPIVGMGGLGKTTLAQLVFNDENVNEHFGLKMWVCVSDIVFETKLLVEKIIKSVTNKSREDLDMDQLKRILHQEINGRRYLLVLDDVWNENREKWFALKDLLSKGGKGSRIIVTTRSKKVAKLTRTMKPYELRVLDDDQSWSLFEKMAFEQGQEHKNSALSVIGKDIVKKCRGLPLAIKTIGRILYFKTSETETPETEWLSLGEKELSKIYEEEEEEHVIATLKLSYDHLPSHLKHCFAYCSLFPKDSIINVQTLINLWMAQGFVKLSDPSQCLEDVGYDYFMNLSLRCLLEAEEIDEWKYVTKCKMHDLIHDLATKVAGTECIMLTSSSEATIGKETHHVSFDNDFELVKLPASLVQAKKIRTFLLPDESYNSARGSISNDVICSFKFLRTLCLNGLEIEKVSNSIGKLKHLRYLELSRNWNIKRLPNSISRLENLQVLRLSLSNLKELPRGIEKLVNLRSLDIGLCPSLTHMPRGLGQLTNLRILSQFAVDNQLMSRHGGELNELMSLNKLRGELYIKNLRHGMVTKDANMKEKQHLQSLVLEWANVETDDEDDELSLEGFQPHPNLKQLIIYNYNGVRLSSWLNYVNLTNLTRLELRYCGKCKYLPPLDLFPSLKELLLDGLSSLEYISDSNSQLFASSTTFFPSLKVLHFDAMPNLKGWWKDIVELDCEEEQENQINKLKLPSFPCLSELFICRCPQLNCMPLFPYLDESLDLFYNSSWKVLEYTLRMNAESGLEIPKTTTEEEASSSSSSSSSFFPLSKLRALCIQFYDGLQSLPECLKSLSSLKSLEIANCYDIEYFYEDDAIIWQSLRSLRLDYLRKLVALPKEIQHLANLQTLEIYYCSELVEIPEWISNLKSLKELRIGYCYRLQSLPEGMRSLICLQNLVIYKCPYLLPRCQKETGEDWPKIAHIPNVDIEKNEL